MLTIQLENLRKLYIIAGCNGAGKTTASYTILPKILTCKEFVNADEIAKGLSPFQPEKASIQAGKLMLNRIKYLLSKGENFAFETTLASKSYLSLLKEARKKEYTITLLFLWLSSPELAIKRVKIRVKEGGHDIPEEIIRRRYESGLKNFFRVFKFSVDHWMLVDNSGEPYRLIAEGIVNKDHIINQDIWNYLETTYYGK